jgi:hypothetical protein
MRHTAQELRTNYWYPFEFDVKEAGNPRREAILVSIFGLSESAGFNRFDLVTYYILASTLNNGERRDSSLIFS